MIENLPAYAWAAGGVFCTIGIRFFWPILKSAFGAQAGQWRTESGFLRQMSDELDRALARADAADARAVRDHDAREVAERRAEKYFSDLAETKTQVQLLTLQLKLANDKIDALTVKLDEVLGEQHARNNRGV